MRFATTMSAIATALLISRPAFAGSFCDMFQATPPERRGAHILFMVDDLLRNWPQDETLKKAMSEAERLETFSDARKGMVAACMDGKDFAAGLSLGEDMAVYKMAMVKFGAVMRED